MLSSRFVSRRTSTGRWSRKSWKEISMNRSRGALAALVIIGLLVGCESWKKDHPKDMSKAGGMQGKSLYDRLGGEPAIRAVVDDFVPRAANDAKVNFTRKGVPGAEWQ